MFKLITLDDIKPEVIASTLESLIDEEWLLVTGVDSYTNVNKQTLLNLNKSLGLGVDEDKEDCDMDIKFELEKLVNARATRRLYAAWDDIELNI